ncbi:MAG: hypothetical protein M3O50_10800 [Myxococcota bacterium]|nr:hypothetical protein [Myxococcota bacterium]
MKLEAFIVGVSAKGGPWPVVPQAEPPSPRTTAPVSSAPASNVPPEDHPDAAPELVVDPDDPEDDEPEEDPDPEAKPDGDPEASPEDGPPPEDPVQVPDPVDTPDDERVPDDPVSSPERAPESAGAGETPPHAAISIADAGISPRTRSAMTMVRLFILLSVLSARKTPTSEAQCRSAGVKAHRAAILRATGN